MLHFRCETSPDFFIKTKKKANLYEILIVIAIYDIISLKKYGI